MVTCVPLVKAQRVASVVVVAAAAATDPSLFFGQLSRDQVNKFPIVLRAFGDVNILPNPLGSLSQSPVP
jgi:hypothetical protein